MGDKTLIDWCEATLNPIVGCRRGCEYCYARRIARRFAGKPGWPADFGEPEFFPERLEIPKKWKRPRRIFVGSMAEIFDVNLPDEWRMAIAEMCRECPQHRFLFLSKVSPADGYQMWEYAFPSNCWFGVSVTSPREMNIAFELQNTCALRNSLFVSFEPLLGDVCSGTGGWGDYNFEDIFSDDYGNSISWVIIGALTGPRGRQPERDWVLNILRAADKYGVPVWMKDNLVWPESERRRELPEGPRSFDPKSEKWDMENDKYAAETRAILTAIEKGEA